MQTIISFFNPPESYTEEQRRDRSIVLSIMGIIIAVLIAILVFNLIRNPTNRLILGSTAAITGIGFILALRGSLTFGRYLIPFLIAGVGTFFTIQGEGLHDNAIFVLFSVPILASLLIRRRGLFIYGILAILCVILVGALEISGIASNELSIYTNTTDIGTIAIILIGVMVAQLLLINRFVRTQNESSDRLANQQQTNQELIELQETLEERIDERTAELETTTLRVERRANQFQAIADIAKSLTSTQDISVLLPEIVRVVSDFLGFYHAGIFLIDENGEYAELRAASSEGGQRMLARNHRLRIGYEGVVGFAARQGRARIALDTGEDAVFFNNPDLPTTRSEVALPLKVGDEVIGVLDVQSEESEAFTDEDIEVLDTLTSLITTAIQSARLFSQTRRALEDSEKMMRQQVLVRWSGYGATGERIGYKFDGSEFQTVYESVDIDEVREAANTGEHQQSEQVMGVPIKLRGETIGVIGIKAKEGRQSWTPSDVAMAQAAAERAALALENARLIEEAQRRAALERMTSEISGKISTTVQFQSIMRTAAEELSRALGSEVLIQIQPDTDNN